MSEWINGDGSFGDVSVAPESIKTLVSSKGFKGVEDVASAYVNLEKFAGAPADRLLRLPDKPDGDWDSVFTKLGMPETADKYDLGADWKHDVPVDEKIIGDFKKFAREKLKLTNNQFKEVVKFQLDTAKALGEAYEADMKAQTEKANADTLEARKAAEKAIRESYGYKTDDDYNAGVLEARKLADKLDIFKTLEAKGLSDDPQIIGMLISMSKNISEQAIPENKGESKVSAAERVKQIMADPAFTNNMHPEHGKLVAEYQQLHGLR